MQNNRAERTSTRCRAVFGKLLWLVIASLFAVNGIVAASVKGISTNAVHSSRKALVLGRGLPLKDPNGGPTHPEGAKDNFLKLMGNLKNDPRKGWTCDLSWDLMKKLGMNPETTSFEELFRYIGTHRLGYRIVMQNMAAGQSMAFWGAAVDNGMMPFAPHYNNTHVRYNDPVGLKAAVAVGGGTTVNYYSHGESLELYDALPKSFSGGQFEDAAESWANQAVAAKFARILDAHSEYNIWDAREHLRQAGSRFAQGWSEAEGFGRVNESTVVTNLFPGAPVGFWGAKSPDNRKVKFTWRNFLQSDFAATVIARKNGQIIYEGNGTNFTWVSDKEGDEEFKFWSKNKSGETSRMETFNSRRVTGLANHTDLSCLIVGTLTRDDLFLRQGYKAFREAMPRWKCDLEFRSRIPSIKPITNAPPVEVVKGVPDYKSIVSEAIERRYNLMTVLAPRAETNGLYDFKEEWDRAVVNGIAVVLAHNSSALSAGEKSAYKDTPPRLFSAIVVGGGEGKNECTHGPGLEFFDFLPAHGNRPADTSQNAGAIAVAIKLAQILEVNTNYNIWDARQHLRQGASHYKQGWTEDSGYGRAAENPEQISELELAPPLEIKAVKSADGKSVAFSWENFLQSDFVETVITKGDGTIIYHGSGTRQTWKIDSSIDETFHFYSQGKTGKRSREELYTVVPMKIL